MPEWRDYPEEWEVRRSSQSFYPHAFQPYRPGQFYTLDFNEVTEPLDNAPRVFTTEMQGRFARIQSEMERMLLNSWTSDIPMAVESGPTEAKEDFSDWVDD